MPGLARAVHHRPADHSVGVYIRKHTEETYSGERRIVRGTAESVAGIW